jgi:hypothetical protein
MSTKRISSLRKAPAIGAFAALALLAASLPVSAQNPWAAARTAPVVSRNLALRGDSRSLLNSSALKPRFDNQVALKQLRGMRPATGVASPVAVASQPTILRAPQPARPQAPLSKMESSFESSETPFAQNVRIPMAAVWSGRIQLAGFKSFRANENVAVGLPGSGSLPAWGVGAQAHPGAWVPSGDTSLGVSLSFRLGRDAELGSRSGALRTLAKMVGVSR